MVFSELDIINHYFNRINRTRNDVIMGIGDDCALLSVSDKDLIAVSTDTLVSGIHFQSDVNPSDLGCKLLAVNLSDLAAMGAYPAWALLAMTLPSINKDWLTNFSENLLQQLDYYNMQLIGGDTNRGPLSFTLTIQGIVPAGCALTRYGARIGDMIYVTGTLGDSAAGLAILQNRLHVKNDNDREYLLSRHLRPQPRILQGQAIRGIASSAIDISDGIIKDLRHIITSSNCGAHINLDNIPYSSALLRCVTHDQALRFALASGEDYELCFTVPEDNLFYLDIALRHTDTSYTCIGIIKPKSEGIKFMIHNQPIDFNWLGFDHFKS